MSLILTRFVIWGFGCFFVLSVAFYCVLVGLCNHKIDQSTQIFAGKCCMLILIFSLIFGVYQVKDICYTKYGELQVQIVRLDKAIGQMNSKKKELLEKREEFTEEIKELKEQIKEGNPRDYSEALEQNENKLKLISVKHAYRQELRKISNEIEVVLDDLNYKKGLLESRAKVVDVIKNIDSIANDVDRAIRNSAPFTRKVEIEAAKLNRYSEYWVWSNIIVD